MEYESTQVARAIEVELRLWRADEAVFGTRLIPQAIPAMLVRPENYHEPLVELRDDTERPVPYTAATYQEEAPGASILVCAEPIPAQVRLLRMAADRGFPIEPRLAGSVWREIEDR